MKNELHILWTNGDFITSEKMVFMYARNSMMKGWWNKITVIIWGSPAKLIAENEKIRGRIEECRIAGVEFTACISCADQLGVSDTLRELGIEVKPWGKDLTDLLQSGKHVLSV